MTEVLYLSYDGMTDPLGQSQVIPYLRGLSAEGFHFHLISFEKKENFRKEHLHIATLLKAYNIEWYPLSYTKKPPVLSTIRDMGKMKRKGAKIIRENNVRIIHCRSYISGIAGMTLSSQTGAKFLFDMRGFYADERVDGGLWDQTNPVYKAVYRYFKKKEKEMLSTADAVISLTKNAKVEIDTWQLRDAAQLPVKVIPCCADLEHFHPDAVSEQAKQKLSEKLHLQNTGPVISYLGAVGTWYLLQDMLHFFKLFLTDHPNAIFLFISHDSFDKITRAADSEGIPATSLRHFAARRNEVPVALSLSDIALFFIKPVFSKSASSPTKQGEIMGMGIPLICNSGIGDTDWVVNKYGAGITVDVSNENDLKSAVKKYDFLKKIPEEQIISGANEFYSLKSGVMKYLEVYRQLLSK